MLSSGRNGLDLVRSHHVSPSPKIYGKTEKFHRRNHIFQKKLISILLLFLIVVYNPRLLQKREAQG